MTVLVNISLIKKGALPGKYGRKNRAIRRKKRKYYGNQTSHSAKSVLEASEEVVDIHTKEIVSALKKKLKLDPSENR